MESRAYPELQLGLYIKLPSQLMHSSTTARALTHQRYVTGTRTTEPAPMLTCSPAPWSAIQTPATTDSRSDYVDNEVNTDYSTGCQSAVVGLLKAGM
jgi:hypothetical protein